MSADETRNPMATKRHEARTKKALKKVPFVYVFVSFVSFAFPVIPSVRDRNLSRVHLLDRSIARRPARLRGGLSWLDARCIRRDALCARSFRARPGSGDGRQPDGRGLPGIADAGRLGRRR